MFFSVTHLQGWNANDHISVTVEMSESSSLHSAKLVSLARSLSGLGFDATNGGLANLNPSPDNDEPPPPVSYFLDAIVSSSSKSPSIMRLTPLLRVCLGVWDWSRTWAFFLWRQEKSGLHPLLQIQKKACLQASSLHFIQWGHTASEPEPMGTRGRDVGSRWPRRRHRGLKADGGGKGFNEGGFWSRSGWSRTTNWARQRGACVLSAVFSFGILPP